LSKFGDIFGKIGEGIGRNSNTLMALGAGLAGAPSFGQGMSRAFQAAGPAGQLDVQNQRQNQTMQALVRRGLAPDLATAAVSSPDILKQLLPQILGSKEWVPVHIKDAYGNERVVVMDKNSGTFKEPGGAGQVASVNPFLAKGVTEVNHELMGEDYLKQFSPEMIAAVKNYVHGLGMPSGNPRRGFTEQMKLIAGKYGQDIGMPADDTSFSGRRTMRNDLSKENPGSAGGQILFARTSLNHLSEVADAAENLKNQDWYFTPLTKGVNWMRGLTTAQQAKVQALEDAAMHYGQEVAKFYGGGSTGEAERQRFMTSLQAAKSPQELASVIAMERRLIPGRLDELQNRVQGTLGERGLKEYPVHSDQSRASMDKIDATTARMRGIKPAGETSSGIPPERLKPGTVLKFDNKGNLLP